MAQTTVPYRPEKKQLQGYVLFKSQIELDRYFDCFKVGGQKLEKKEKRAIEIVSRHYNLPTALMSCTLFIESRFNHLAISPVGATGLAQLMPETLLTIVSINSPATKAQLAGCSKKEKFTEAETNYCNALYEQQRYVALWTSIQGKLKAEVLLKGKFQYDPFSPIESITMSGMYLNYILNTIDQRSGLPQGKKMNERMIDEYKITLAAYNRGLGKIASMIQKQKENGEVNLSKIVEEIRINKETSEHMDAIERCLTKNDFRQPINTTPEKTLACSFSK